MNRLDSKNISFEKVIGSTNQIAILYKLLRARSHNISNTKSLPLREHVYFVKNHPYRAWYLIKYRNEYIGSAYILKSNALGINLENNESMFIHVLNFIFKKYKPLKEIKSIRSSDFHINLPPSNKILERELIKMGAKLIQSTYSLSNLRSK